MLNDTTNTVNKEFSNLIQENKRSRIDLASKMSSSTPYKNMQIG